MERIRPEQLLSRPVTPDTVSLPFHQNCNGKLKFIVCYCPGKYFLRSTYIAAQVAALWSMTA